MNEVLVDLRPVGPRALVATAPPLDWAALLRERVFPPAAGFLALCLLLGGASNGGVAPNALLQVAAVALLLWLALERRAPPTLPAQRAAIGFALAAVALALLQLVPLPPALWTALPGRAAVRAGYALLGQPLPWLPLTLQPERSVAALLGMLPPLAMLALALRLGREARVALLLVVVAGALGSALLGWMQAATGAALLRPYAGGTAAGVFAAAADEALLSLLALACLAPVAARQVARMRHDRRARWALVGCGVGAVTLVTTVAGAGALLLLPIVLGATTLIALSPRLRGVRLVAASAGAMVGGVALAAVMGPGAPASTVALEAARAYLPFGAGMGTFAALSGAATPLEALGRAAPAHAGSDVAELLLEGGLVALALSLAFAVWAARQVWAAWRAGGPGAPLRQAGALIVGGVLLASLAAAPMRTAALGAVAALGLALLADHPRPLDAGRRRRR